MRPTFFTDLSEDVAPLSREQRNDPLPAERRTSARSAGIGTAYGELGDRANGTAVSEEQAARKAAAIGGDAARIVPLTGARGSATSSFFRCSGRSEVSTPLRRVAASCFALARQKVEDSPRY